MAEQQPHIPKCKLLEVQEHTIDRVAFCIDCGCKTSSCIRWKGRDIPLCYECAEERDVA
jgi:hypothetical protein